MWQFLWFSKDTVLNMIKKKFLWVVIVLFLLLAPTCVYEYYTLPQPILVMSEKSALGLIKNNSDSTTAIANLSAFGSNESVLIGADAAKNVGVTEYLGISIFVIKISQNVNFPLTGISYVINYVDLKYGDSNSTLPTPVSTRHLGSGLENIYKYEYGIAGNFTLTYYIHITSIAEIGIFHFPSETITANVSVNVAISN